MRETDGKTLGNPIAGGHIIPRIGFTDVAASDVCVCSLLMFLRSDLIDATRG
jgi:hypothetical protein